jgi:RNA polymerase sigma-70 factor (ECF subfamily)
MGGVMGFEPARPGNVPSASARRHFSGRPGTSRPRPALSFEGLAQRANEEASPVPGLKEHETASPRTEIVALIPALRAFARTFYRETSEADDLVQETLTRALTSIHQFRPGTSMKSWLFTIMRNAFYTKVRVETREAPGTAECVSLRPAADATQEWSARGREMERAIQRLPEQQREVLMLIGVLGVSYDEAAAICGCAMGTVKSRLNRARIRLLEELGEATPNSSVEHDVSHPVGSMPQRPKYG